MATTDELIRFVIHEIDTHMSRLTSGRDYLPRQMAAAALARGRKLWAALDAVQAAGQAVVGGLLSRAIWECWVVGLFVLFKGDDGYEHLAGAYDRANDLITDRWPDDETRPDLRGLGYPKQKLNYETMATEVTRLLAERGSPVVTLSYDGLYRSWSTLAAHATQGSLMLFVEDTGSYLKLGPGRLPLPAEVDLRVTSTFLGHLAWFVLRSSRSTARSSSAPSSSCTSGTSPTTPTPDEYALLPARSLARAWTLHARTRARPSRRSARGAGPHARVTKRAVG